MKTVTTAEAEARLAECIAEAANGPVILTENDRPVAALVAITDSDDVERLARGRPLDLGRLLDERAEEIKRTGGLSHEELWRAVDALYEQTTEDAKVQGT